MSSPATKFQSPRHKVLQFLERSRDLWKRKPHELKMQIKLAANQVRAVEKSRQAWRERALAAEVELRQASRSKNIAHHEAS
jgi:hypothetical protein